MGREEEKCTTECITILLLWSGYGNPVSRKIDAFFNALSFIHTYLHTCEHSWDKWICPSVTKHAENPSSGQFAHIKVIKGTTRILCTLANMARHFTRVGIQRQFYFSFAWNEKAYHHMPSIYIHYVLTPLGHINIRMGSAN